MPNTKIAAAYIRVSTEEQTEYSPDAQLVEIRKYAARNGFVVSESFVYMDEGISGKKTFKRDAFNQMIGVAKQKPKPFEAILLWKFSRFARNREDSVVYKSMLRKQLGIEVISISEPVGDDKMSILIEALIEAMDEYYSINLAEEVKRGMTEKAKRGGLQSTPPFGYGVKDNILIPLPKEAELVREIFTRFIAGEGLFPIAKWLNTLGVKTHRGSRFENRSVEYIVCNPAYIGKLRWNPSGRTRRDFSNEHIILADAKHEALITEEIWEAAQNRMAQVKEQWRYKARPASEHKDWLSGLIRCSECGNTLLYTKPHYWKCNGYTKGACQCSQHTRDEKLKAMLLSIMEHDAFSNMQLAYTMAQSSVKRLDEEAFLREQLENTEKKLLRLREAYLTGVETLESYSGTKKAIEQQKEKLQTSLRNAKQAKEETTIPNAIRDNIQNCMRLLEGSEASQEEKYRELHNILDHGVYSKEHNKLLLTYRVQL